MSTIRIPAKRGRIRVAAKADRTYNGVVYHSKAEARYAAELDILKKAGVITEWWRQIPFGIKVQGRWICDVVVDFKILDRKEYAYYVEIKGHETEVYRLKRDLLLACYPGIDYRVVKA